MPSSNVLLRLQKVIAQSGLASRRQAESLIQKGSVTVNGHIVTELGTRVHPQKDHVKVNGRHLKPFPPDVFIMLNKPPGYLSTLDDPFNRPTIVPLFKSCSTRVFPVGRLDYDSGGLLLLTNHGGISHACLHPGFHVSKCYLAKIKGVLDLQAITQLEKGVMLQDGLTAPAKVRKVRKVASNSWIELTIHEGRTHQVKRMLDAVGHPVIRLTRIRFGPLELGDLASGTYRYLTDKEANALRALLQRKPALLKKPSKAASGQPSMKKDNHPSSKRQTEKNRAPSLPSHKKTSGRPRKTRTSRTPIKSNVKNRRIHA